MARPSNRALRRAQIVSALAELMAERGYDGASIGAIAKRAGLAPGLVHYHFGSKQEILVALVESMATALRERMELRVRPTDNAWEQLEAWIDAHLALGPDASPGAVACWVAIGAEASRRPEVQEIYERAVRDDLARAEALVVAVMKAGGGTEHEPRQVAEALLSAIEGSYRLAAGAPGVVEPGFAAPMARALARGMLGAP